MAFCNSCKVVSLHSIHASALHKGSRVQMWTKTNLLQDEINILVYFYNRLISPLATHLICLFVICMGSWVSRSHDLSTEGMKDGVKRLEGLSDRCHNLRKAPRPPQYIINCTTPPIQLPEAYCPVFILSSVVIVVVGQCTINFNHQ